MISTILLRALCIWIWTFVLVVLERTRRGASIEARDTEVSQYRRDSARAAAGGLLLAVVTLLLFGLFLIAMALGL